MMKAAKCPKVSIIVNTNGRCDSLYRTLESLRYLDYDEFEVCVVYGPAPDGTADLLHRYESDIKVARCPEQNLSMSRNIGIELGAGELLAFIDDDGIPEPEWLTGIAEAFADPEVGACGGLIYDQTGYKAQHLFVTCNRLGRARHNHDAPAEDLNYPFAFEYPAVTGTNAVFRRQALQEIGGFDEEFEYYLDETDVCCRLIDAGWKIRQLSDAPVHHKFLPSHVRTAHRVTNPYPLIKNKVYFSLVHALPYWPMERVLNDCIDFSRERRREHEHHVRLGHIPEYAMEIFDRDAEAAWRDGLLRGLSPDRRRKTASSLVARCDFKPFKPVRAEGKRRVLVFLSQDYPPQPMTGVSRYTHDIARALAGMGHTVHVLTQGADLNTVDLQEGVWVHRLLPLKIPSGSVPGLDGTGVRVPSRIAGLTFSYAQEIARISRFRRIDVVEAPSWDVEGLGVLLSCRAPLVMNIVTTMATFLETHPELSRNGQWMAEYGTPLLKLEKKMFAEADGIIAASHAIVDSIEQHYEATIEADRVAYVPHLSSDLTSLPRSRPAELADFVMGTERIAVLFVGRLEARKGIDVLLAAATVALARNPRLEFWIAGDASHTLADGLTAEQTFRAYAPPAVLDAVLFLGVVSDDALLWLLANCSMVAIPSRFESYGLVAIEAMMFGKPVVASCVGGLVELVRHNRNGLLIPVEDHDVLAGAIVQLAGDRGLRDRLSAGSLSLYEELYRPERLAKQRLDALSRYFRVPLPRRALDIFEGAEMVALPYQQLGWLLTGHEPVVFRTSSTRIWLNAWTHKWSGILELRLDGSVFREFDLFSTTEAAKTISVTLPRTGLVQLYRTGRRSPHSLGTEVILMEVLMPDGLAKAEPHEQDEAA